MAWLSSSTRQTHVDASGRMLHTANAGEHKLITGGGLFIRETKWICFKNIAHIAVGFRTVLRLGKNFAYGRYIKARKIPRISSMPTRFPELSLVELMLFHS